jgi:hypothetical protein
MPLNSTLIRNRFHRYVAGITAATGLTSAFSFGLVPGITIGALTYGLGWMGVEAIVKMAEAGVRMFGQRPIIEYSYQMLEDREPGMHALVFTADEPFTLELGVHFLEGALDGFVGHKLADPFMVIESWEKGDQHVVAVKCYLGYGPATFVWTAVSNTNIKGRRVTAEPHTLDSVADKWCDHVGIPESRPHAVHRYFDRLLGAMKGQAD